MDDLCRGYVQTIDKEIAEKIFRDNVVFYFTSKYANELIVKINEFENQEDFEIFTYFLSKIENPPENEVGLELNNAKHILGACQRYKALGIKNNIINLLSSFSTLLLEGKVNGHLLNFLTSIIVKEQISVCVEAFYYFSQIEELNQTRYLSILKKYTSLLKAIIPETSEISKAIYTSASLFILQNKLNSFTNKFSA